MDYRSGRLAFLAELRFLIQNHDMVYLSENYDRNSFKAITQRSWRLNLLSKYNQNLSPEFQRARQDLLDLLLEFHQLHYENNIEKKVAWFSLTNTWRKEVICENFERSLRREKIRIRSTIPRPEFYEDGSCYRFRAIRRAVERNYESISEIELWEILNSIECHYYFSIMACF